MQSASAQVFKNKTMTPKEKLQRASELMPDPYDSTVFDYNMSLRDQPCDNGCGRIAPIGRTCFYCIHESMDRTFVVLNAIERESKKHWK